MTVSAADAAAFMATRTGSGWLLHAASATKAKTVAALFMLSRPERGNLL
jgi:hypothetical protein